MTTCHHTGRELTIAETFVNVAVDGSYNREDNGDGEWVPVGRECAQELRDRGCLLAGIVTPL